MSKFSISFVGDIFPGNLPLNKNCGVASIDLASEEKKAHYAHLLKVSIGGDGFIIGNLESPIIKNSEMAKCLQFAGKSEFVEVLKRAEVTHLSLANNHIYEQNKGAVENTISELKSKDIVPLGLSMGGEDTISYIDKEGVKVALIAFNDIDNQRIGDDISKYDFQKVCEIVQKVREDKSVDYIVLLLHWGDEFVYRPSNTQISQAHKLIDMGANFVICSHPHVIQPIEEYGGGLIAYSLGNFVFDMTIPKRTTVGMVLTLSLSKTKFEYKYHFVKLGKDYFPQIIKNPKKYETILKRESKFMLNHDSSTYSTTYNKYKRRKRLEKRVFEKLIILKNWNKYSPQIRKEYISLFIGKFKKHGSS